MAYPFTTEYNGWANYETWNVMAWIYTDYPVYRAWLGYKGYPQAFLSFREDLKKGMLKCTETGDGVSLWDKKLDIDAINKSLKKE